MNVPEELTAIYQLLESQEKVLIDLHRSLRAMLETLSSEQRMFDIYRSTYNHLGGSRVLLEHDPILRTIHEGLERVDSDKGEQSTH